jgi:hypothetical protein
VGDVRTGGRVGVVGGARVGAARVGAAGIGAVLLGGCAILGPGPDATPVPTAVATASADPSDTGDAAAAPTAVPLTVGDLTVTWSVPAGAPVPTPTADEDGATTLDVTVGADGTALTITPPAGTTAAALADGSVVLRRDGAFVAGITSVRTANVTAPAASVQADGAVVWAGQTGASAAVTLATVAVRDATWAERGDEGGLSLMVEPSTWARSGGLAVDEGLWAQLTAIAPDAATQAVHDQLTCHTIGAPDKDTWNLEPWRPDVGLLATLSARCNPEP